MPTPVNTARQCLTQEAARALDDAVSVARRRSHPQTTSLHAISAFLSLSSSPLREACGRARNTAYTARIQFKALELCLGVSLDRLPSSPQRLEEPPVSNSLMAAIKRSQANQRRQPENFQLYQLQQQTASSCSSSSTSSVSTVKVELQNLILSILDDPVVSRVFGEAGFRSCEIKLAIIRPVHQLLRYKGPPVFLCNLTDNSAAGCRSFSFPFPNFSGFFESDENCKRIGEILVRKTGKGKNPLLVGICAVDALKNFLEMIQRRNVNVFPMELSGVNVICIETEILKFVTGNYDGGFLKLRLEEVERTVKQCIGPGVVINFGDLKVLIGENASVEAANYVVRELGRLIVVHGGKIWVIGATARHETYLEFLKRFLSIEKDWDLQVLPLTSPRSSPMGETFPKSSLMESFVPFGGFFSTPSDIKSPLNGSNHYVSRCHLCNEKCKQEVNAISEGGFSASVADQYQSSLPSWLQMSQLCTNREFDVAKAKDDSMVLSAKVVGLQKKWDNICQRLHQSQPYTQMLPKAAYKVGTQVPVVVDFQVIEGGKENGSTDRSINTNNASSLESGCEDIKSCKSMDLKLPSKLGEKHSPSSLSSSSIGDELASPLSANSVTTDLGLGVNCDNSAVYHGQFGQKDFKMLYTSLSIRVSWQEEAVRVVSQTIARCRTRNDRRRGDIWFSLIGPDKIAKKKIAFALAEALYGDRDNIISVDLSFQDPTEQKLRGKNIIDLIADELRKKPLSVVFLENMDMADLLAQNHLSCAVKTGKFSDSHGREVSISNAIFLTTLRFTGISNENEIANYSEEDVLKAKGCPIQMFTGFDLGDDLINQNPRVINVITRKPRPTPICMNKRKLIGISETQERCQQTTEIAKRAHLDLNLPAEESETHYDLVSESSKVWLEDFLKQVDKKVTFKPFDFDSLAEKILEEISGCFQKMVGSESLLEIDSKVMEQILAAACLLENSAVENWIEQVLSSAFVEARKKYSLSSHSVVKLMACESLFQEEQMQLPGVLLPAKIIMN